MKLRELFSTPKRAVISTLVIVALAGAIVTGCVLTFSGIAGNKNIGEEEALRIALADAGVDKAAAAIQRTDYELEDGKFLYEIEFTADGTEYEYQIIASDGRIFSCERDVSDDWAKLSTSETQPQNTSSDNVNTDVNSGNADTGSGSNRTDNGSGSSGTNSGNSSNRTDNASGSSSTNSGNNSNRTDNGSGSFAANSGNGSNRTGNATSPQNTDSTISKDKAKSIALQHAGVSPDAVTFTKAALEKDNGITEYEIEFYLDGTEYEYTINAADGNILDYDVDVLD